MNLQMKSSPCRGSWVTAAAGVILTLAMYVPTSANATYTPTPAPDCKNTGAANRFAARAYSVLLDSNVAGIAVDVGPFPDTGQLPSTGGKRNATLATVDGVNLPMPFPSGLNVDAAILNNVVMGSGNLSTAYSSVLNLDLGLSKGVTSLLAVSADAVTAKATVGCTLKTRKVNTAKTGSEIVNLAIKVMGKSILIPAHAPPNTRLVLPAELNGLASGSITLNEQSTYNGRQVVNAVHVKLKLLSSPLVTLASVDLIISHAEANIVCGQGTDPDSCNCSVKDFVTGGGEIRFDNGKASFAIHGGSMSSGPSGHLDLVNHYTRQHIKGYVLTGYTGTGNARRLTFKCSDNTYLNNAKCVADVEDNGNLGGGIDKFGLSPGYPKRLISHGNIVLHKPSCGSPH